jgi:hypothetical protein
MRVPTESPRLTVVVCCVGMDGRHRDLTGPTHPRGRHICRWWAQVASESSVEPVLILYNTIVISVMSETLYICI